MSKKIVYLLGVLFSLTVFSFSELSYGATAYGTFKVVKGKVKVISAKTGKKKRARLGQRVSPGDTIITGKDSRVKIVMVDKNVINISPDSQVVFEKYQYEPKSNKKNVLLKVLYGKVRAKVEQKYNEKSNRFQIKTPSAVAGVRGTDFFTSYNVAAKSTKIVTFKGRVAFGLPGANGAILNPVMVKVGQFTTNVAGVKPIPPIKVPKQELVKLDVGSDADKSPKGGAAESRVPAGDKEGKKKKGDKPKKGEAKAADGNAEQPKAKPDKAGKKEPKGKSADVRQDGNRGRKGGNGPKASGGPGGVGAPGLGPATGDGIGGGAVAGNDGGADGGFRGPASDSPTMMGPGPGDGFAPGDCSMCTMDDITVAPGGDQSFFGPELVEFEPIPIYDQFNPDQTRIGDIVENIITDGNTQLIIHINTPTTP